MKKVIFIILSSIFILVVPNVVNAETTGMDFGSRTASFGSSTTTSVPIISGYLNYGDSTGYFSFTATSSYVLPYTATLYMSDGNEYSCSLTSVGGQWQGQNIYTVSAYCPFIFTANSRPVRVGFERAFSDNVLDYIQLPYRMQVVKGFYFDSSSITNSQQQTTNAINGVNDSINNDTVSPNSENSSTAQSWASQSASDSVVSDMVLMPITLLNAFSSGFNGSCQAYNLGSLYGTNLTLPCINIQNYLGATLWGIIDVLMSGFLIYGIGKKFVRVFNDFTNLKDSQVDELYGGGNE